MKQKNTIIIAVLLISLISAAVSAQTVKDINGNVDKTVTIGTQTWMAENLKTINYNDGTPIPFVVNNTAWINHDSVALTAPAYYWYDNDSTYKDKYGALYNGYTLKTCKLCPTGWHVPTDTEWSVLTDYLGGEGVAGGKLKETGYTHWATSNAGATNETGFNALPGGSRFMDGSFKLGNEGGNWWSPSDYNSERTWFRPVSTTHIAVGAVMGVGLARGIGGLDLRVIGGIVVSWFITVPFAAIMAAIVFYILKAIFS